MNFIYKTLATLGITAGKYVVDNRQEIKKNLGRFIQDAKVQIEEFENKEQEKIKKVINSSLSRNNRKKSYSNSKQTYSYFADESNSPKIKKHIKADKKNKITEIYVYICSINEGEFYFGHTNNLKARMMEHRDGLVMTTKNKNPKLVYFETFKLREDATKFERDLKFLNKRNPRKIRELIVKFKSNLDELG
tara:strand:+ start:32 stop:604 length:573 start_codon:yes stop_codon:yes gene_type:complete